jgi:hypothetical protein
MRGVGRRPGSTPALPADYGDTLTAIKRRVIEAHARAASTVDRELVMLNWSIGRDILDRQPREGWGSAVIEKLGVDLRTAFPGSRGGFSRRNLFYMRRFAALWPDSEKVPSVMAQIGWTAHPQRGRRPAPSPGGPGDRRHHPLHGPKLDRRQGRAGDRQPDRGCAMGPALRRVDGHPSSRHRRRGPREHASRASRSTGDQGAAGRARGPKGPRDPGGDRRDDRRPRHHRRAGRVSARILPADERRRTRQSRRSPV